MTDDVHARMVDFAKKLATAEDFEEAGCENIWCQECGGEIPDEVRELAKLIADSTTAPTELAKELYIVKREASRFLNGIGQALKRVPEAESYAKLAELCRKARDRPCFCGCHISEFQ